MSEKFRVIVVLSFVLALFGTMFTALTIMNGQEVRAKGTLRITQDGEYLIYPARILRIVDGDTVDLRFRIWTDTLREERIRLLGIDAPEVRGIEREEGLRTTEYLRTRTTNVAVYLKTDGSEGKYGRLLGILMIAGPHGLIDLNQEMLEKGLARPYN